METNYFICPNCPDGHGGWERTRHIEVSAAEVLAREFDGSKAKGAMSALGRFVDYTGIRKAIDMIDGIKCWKCTKCGMISERTADGEAKHYMIEKTK